MKLHRLLLLLGLLGASALVLPGCPDETDDDDATSDDDDATSDDDDATADDDDSAGDDDDSAGDDDDSAPDPFVFTDFDGQDLLQSDRAGMPAVTAALILPSDRKEAYNAGGPVDDEAFTFVPDITSALEALHGALDDDITDAGLVPCAVETKAGLDVSLCVSQGGPLIIPDTIEIDLEQDAGFPNGRLLTDPVIDVTLAVILLDLSVSDQEATTLIGLNPTANDVAFQGTFPYLAPPH